MNYIQQFMRNKKLVPGQPFRVSNARNLWFCFTEDYRLDLYGDDEYMRTCLNFESILLQLLSGEISVSPVVNESTLNADYVVHILNEFGKLHPDTPIIMETQHGTVRFKIGDALVYESFEGDIVIDSE
jgi:hypothetical protein